MYSTRSTRQGQTVTQDNGQPQIQNASPSSHVLLFNTSSILRIQQDLFTSVVYLPSYQKPRGASPTHRIPYLLLWYIRNGTSNQQPPRGGRGTRTICSGLLLTPRYPAPPTRGGMPHGAFDLCRCISSTTPGILTKSASYDGCEQEWEVSSKYTYIRRGSNVTENYFHPRRQRLNQKPYLRRARCP